MAVDCSAKVSAESDTYPASNTRIIPIGSYQYDCSARASFSVCQAPSSLFDDPVVSFVDAADRRSCDMVCPVLDYPPSLLPCLSRLVAAVDLMHFGGTSTVP